MPFSIKILKKNIQVDLDLNNIAKIINVPDSVNPGDAVNKQQLDIKADFKLAIALAVALG